MAGRHVGIDIGVHIDESPLDRVNQRIDRTKANAEQLSQTMGRIKVPDSASGGFDRINRASGEATSKVKGLTDAYKHVGTSSNLNRASGELDNLTSKAGKAASSTDKLKQSMNHASEQSKAMGNMGSAFDKTRSSSDHARNSIDKTTESSGKLYSGWEKLKGAGAGLVRVGSAISAAMVPVAAAFMQANDQAIKLADEYNVIKNLQETGGNSAETARRNTRAIQAENRRLSLRYGVSQNELAAGSEQLLRRGYSGKQDLGAHKYFLQAARATNEDYNSIVASAAPMLEQFGYKAKAGNSVGRMSKYTRDVLNKASYVADLTAGNVGGENGFGESFKMMGSAAHSNGQSIDTVLGALGTLSNFGEEGSSAGTGMRQIITRLIKAPGSKPMTSALSDLGINPQSLYTRSGKLKQLGTIFGMFNRAARGKKPNRVSRDMQTLFGQTGFNDAQILMAHAGNMQQNVQDSKKAARSGYISKLSAKNMESLKNQMARTKALASDVGMTFAKEVDPGLGKALGSANSLLKAFMGMPEPLKKASAYILGAVGALGASRLASGFLKANFGIGNGKGIGAGIGRAILGKKVKGSPREGGLINAIKGNTWGGAFQSLHSAGGFRNLSTAGKIATGLAGAGVALDAGSQFVNAYKDRHNANKRSQDIGKGIGAGIGGGIGLWLGGPLGAAIGAKIGSVAGKWGGGAVNRFTKGWQAKKPPKSFWSMANLGWSTHNMFKQIGSGWNHFWGGMGNWRKKEARAFGRWASQTGRSIKKGFNGAKTFVKNIPSNLGKTGKSIKEWADKTGQNIHKGWNRGITASHKFFKNLPKNIDKTKQNIGKWSRQTGRNISSAWRKGQKATVNFVKHIPSNLNKAKRGVERWGTRTGKSLQSTWHKGTTAVDKFVGSIPSHLAKAERSTVRWAGKTGKNIHSAWDKGKQGLTSFVTSIPKELGKAYTAVLDWAGKVGKTVSKAWNNFWGKAGDIRKGITNNVKAFGNDLNFMVGGSKHTFKYEKIKSHASGGLITATHHALVGEAGPELAYKRGLNARLLGTNGPQITRVHAGEHILNARDTAKVLSGGLGTGVTLKGYASGTDRLKTASKSVIKDYKDIADKSTKSLKKLSRSNKRAFSQVNQDANKQTKQAKSRTVSNFNSLHKNVSKLTDKTKKDSITNFKQMHHGINKQMDAIHDGVISSGKSTAKGFGGAMDKMHKYAHSAMADTTRQLNKGISSIDKVLGQFGGNNSVIKPIKFAKGTDQQGRLTHNTLAMVNDATQGPRQEALVSPDNKLYLPEGQNVQLMLPAGWGVLNGTQTKQIINKTVNHYAKGTGISHSALRRLAENAGADPSKWFKSTYSNDIKQHGSDLNKGTTALGSNSSTKYGNPWSNALWGVINKQIDSDSISATGLLKAAEKYGEGHKYVWGATGPNTFDCSGLVMYTLKHAYGINYPHFSGSQYNMTRHISKGEAHMGDLVFWGSGGSDHVGIYAGGNKYFSAESPSQGIHMSTLDSVVGKGRPLFGRIKGMPSQKAKPKHQQKADSRLTALVKRELGASALRWIKDNLGEEGGSFGNPAGDGVARWRKYITRAASQMHTSVTGTEIAKILSMISSESSGDPTITQQIQDINSAKGTPAQGLLQFVPSTFNAFAAKGHHKLLNGYDQLLALFNDSNWRNDIHFGGGWGPSGHRRFAKGGRPKVGQNVIVGEHGPEIARFDSPVQIYSNEKSRRSLNLGKLPDVQHASSKKHFTGKFAPVININFNGSASDFDSKQARKIAEIVQRELEKVFNSIDEEFC